MEPEGSLPWSQQLATFSILRCMNPVNALLSILILSYHLRLCLIISLFPAGFPTKILYIFIFSSIRAICSIHPFLRDLINLIILQTKNHKQCIRKLVHGGQELHKTEFNNSQKIKL